MGRTNEKRRKESKQARKINEIKIFKFGFTKLLPNLRKVKNLCSKFCMEYKRDVVYKLLCTGGHSESAQSLLKKYYCTS